MTDFVIDANVLMSILISGKAGYRPILTFNNFILPDFASIEVEKYKDIVPVYHILVFTKHYLKRIEVE